jgi:hypothetical protein
MFDLERLDLPSASQMWRNSECHGNRILIESLREKGILGSSQEQTADSKLGDRIHASLAGEPETLERKAEETKNECEKLANKAATQFFGQEPDEFMRILYEQRFWYHIGETPFFSAKPDRLYIDSTGILDPNFKTGRNEEEDAHLNLQLRTEVVVIKHCYPEVPLIGVCIIQPWVTHTPEIALYDEEACHKALIEILEIVDATAWDDKRKAGPWCKFCPARAFCPEARELATRYPITINVDALPDGQAGAEVLEKVKIAEGILEALKSAYKQKITDEPDSIPGWWIGKGKKIRYVNGWKKAEEIALSLFEKTTAVSFDDLVTLPIGKLEQWADEKLELHGKAFDEAFESVICTKQTAGSLEKIPKKYLK